jgi:hypothetical protein
MAVNGSTSPRPLTMHDLFLKDAFLVFRAMCKLTMKPLNTERFEQISLHHCFPLYHLSTIPVNAT